MTFLSPARSVPVLGRFAAAFLLTVFASGCDSGPSVATYRVERQPFVHRVLAEGNLSPTQATNISVPTQVRQAVRIAWRADDGVALEAGDVVVRFDPVDMERELEKARSDLEQSRLKAMKADATSEERSHGVSRQRAEAELQLDVAERFEKSDEGIYSRHEIIESQIDTDLAVQRKQQATELEAIHRDLSQAENDLLDIETRRANQRIDQARSGLRELEIRAPHSGLLTWNRDWRGEVPEVGQQVWAGQQLAQIPRLDRMKAEVYVLEADAGGVAPGQAATLRVDAHPSAVIRGKITRVDAVAKAPYRGTPLQFFGVELELDPETVGDERLRPGQRVSATLLIEDLDDVLVLPRQALMTDRDEPYVWLKQGARFVPREIVLGPQSTSQVVVEAGLEPGDLVALEPVDSTPGTRDQAPTDTGGLSPTATGA